MPDIFDYLIVGGGTAGCVLAEALGRLELGTVAVLESGCAPVGRYVHTPALYSQAFGSRWDWNLETVPQPHLKARRVRWPRGRMLGGSSGLNAMIYSRGSPSDFEKWPAGWGYNDVLPHFETIEKFFFRSAFDIDDRPWPRDRMTLPPLHPLSERFLEAGKLAGFPQLSNHGLEAEPGVCRYLRTQRNGRRNSAYSQFLKRSTATVIDQANVEEVLLSDQTAVGIRFRRRDEEQVIRCRRAVILAAGAIHSPLILQRSGIGPADRLRSAGIPLKREIDAVGKNLQDHLVYPLIYRSRYIAPLVSLTDRQARLEYAKQRTGPLASNIAEAGGFAIMRNDSRLPPSPEIQWHFVPVHYWEYSTRSDPTQAWSIAVTLLHPESRGRIDIDPTDFRREIIDPAYLSADGDLDQLARAVQFTQLLAEQTPLAECSQQNLIPGTKRSGIDGIARSIQAYASTLYHPVGTCRIGESFDSVVDPQLRVRGLENLYVADASIIPHLPSANPQSVAMIIGSKMASILGS